jgi:large conductance mechanosensitive channel
MSFVKEFKEFAVKGNVIDMAVGIMIGAAFKSIVTSFVNDVVMPVIGQIIGGVDFKKLYITLNNVTYQSFEEAVKAGAPIIKYGAFIQTIVDFIIVALTIFVVIKVVTKLQKEESQEAVVEETPTTPEDITLLREIRDSLKK